MSQSAVSQTDLEPQSGDIWIYGPINSRHSTRFLCGCSALSLNESQPCRQGIPDTHIFPKKLFKNVSANKAELAKQQYPELPCHSTTCFVCLEEKRFEVVLLS